MKKTGILLLILLLVSCYQTGLAQSGIYITAESGWANQYKMPDIPCSNSINQKHIPAGRLGVGYLHDVDDKFGLGAEVAGGWYHGTTYNLSDKQINAFSSTIEFLGVFVLYSNPVGFFVKIGGIRHTLNNFSVIVNDSKANETKIQAEIAGGINYNFNRRFALTSEYVHSFGSNIKNFDGNVLNCPSINAILVGARITFG